MHLDIGTQLIVILSGFNVQEAGATESALAADALRPIAEVVEALPRQAGFNLQIVVHSHQSAGTASCAERYLLPLQDNRFKPAFCEMICNTCPDNPCPNDDDIEIL